MGEGVLEGIRDLGEQPRLVEELGGLQMGEAHGERLLRRLGHGLEERQGHLRADDGGGLQEPFSAGGSRSMRAARTACTVAGT